MMKRCGIIYNNRRRDVEAFKNLTVKKLTKEGIEVWCETDECAKDNTDLIIILGGDGTILRGFREYMKLEVPFVCVNFGKVGFLSSVEPGAFIRYLPRLLNQDYYIEERSVLQFSIIDNNKANKSYYALNEIVIRSNKPVISRLSVYINGFLCMDVEGDGLICATSTGSTAYSLSAGGPIVDYHINGIVITPICSRGNVKPCIVAPDRNLQIFINDYRTDYIIVADGITSSNLSYQNQIKLSISPIVGKFVYLEKEHYYKKLSSIII